MRKKELHVIMKCLQKKFAYLTMKTVFWHAFHVGLSFLHISQAFPSSLFPRPEMTCFAIV